MPHCQLAANLVCNADNAAATRLQVLAGRAMACMFLTTGHNVCLLSSHPLSLLTQQPQASSHPSTHTADSASPVRLQITSNTMKSSLRSLASHIPRPESFIVSSKRTPFGAYGGK